MIEPTLDRQLYPALWRQLDWYLTAPESVLSRDELEVRADVRRLLAERDEARAERDRETEMRQLQQQNMMRAQAHATEAERTAIALLLERDRLAAAAMPGSETVAGRAARLLEEAAWSRDLDAERDEEGGLFGDAEDARAHAAAMRAAAAALRAACPGAQAEIREAEAWLRAQAVLAGEAGDPKRGVAAGLRKVADHIAARGRHGGGAKG